MPHLDNVSQSGKSQESSMVEACVSTVSGMVYRLLCSGHFSQAKDNTPIQSWAEGKVRDEDREKEGESGRRKRH